MKKILLILIILLAFVLRFYKLSSYPALNADEAAIGYNAYSLLLSGKDEHGNPWPVHFQSFNDYKPGLYFYLVLPTVALLGLNEWAVRIPNAFLGVLTVYLLYLLVIEMFNGQWLMIRNSKSTINPLPLAIIAAFILAISPWHIHFSRGGWEVNTATFLMVAGIYFFLKAIKKPNFLNFMFLVLSFTMSLYTYHAARVVVPLLGLGLLIIYEDFVKKNIKSFLLASFLGLIILLPLIGDFTKSDISSRVAGVGLFADSGPLSRINEQRGEHGDYRSLPAKILHNKLVNFGLAFLDNWGRHYHGEFLFLSGDIIQRNRVPETGQLYIFDFIFIAVGIVFILKSKILNLKSKYFIIWWLIVAPTAAALTFQSPHALRAQNMIIPLTIISAFGLVNILDWLNRQKRYLSVIGYSSLVVLMVWQFMLYQHMYWVHMAKEYPFSSQYGVKELVEYVKGSIGKYNRIIVTDRYDQPYILFLFYLKYPPQEFQDNHSLSVRDKYGFSTVRSFGKFEFQKIDWDNDKPANPNSLIVGTDEEIPKEANRVAEIYGTNGYKYFEVVAN